MGGGTYRFCYSPHLVTEDTELIAAAGSNVVPGAPPALPRLATLRQLLVTLLSAARPGLGHLLRGQASKGMILSASFVGLVCGFWPLRLLRYYAGFALLFTGWISLAVYTACSTQLIPNGRIRMSKWWFALTIPASLIILSLSGGVLIRASGFRSFAVPSTSMEPTIQRGDRIVVDNRAFRLQGPQYRDVVVCYRDGTFLIKRVIALGGDTVEGQNGNIILNGRVVNESYIQHSRMGSPIEWQVSGMDWMQTFGPVTVPAGKYFVLGDNRDVSLDSRSPEFGFVDRGSILGKVLYVYSAGREGMRIR